MQGSLLMIGFLRQHHHLKHYLENEPKRASELQALTPSNRQ